MKVDFMIIGAQKCGTTTIAQILSRHPKVGFCSKKEPHFFSKTKNWKKDLESYHALFPQKEGLLLGEASTSYTMYPTQNLEIWEDLYEYNKDLKFIYLVRPPLERIPSHYVQLYETHNTSAELSTELKYNVSYYANSMYAMQVSPFIERFGRDNVLIIELAELKNNMSNVLNRLADFLNIESKPLMRHKNLVANSFNYKRENYKLRPLVKLLRPFGTIFPKAYREKIRSQILSINQRKLRAKPTLSLKQQKAILNIIEPDISEMENILDKELPHWRSGRLDAHK